MCVWVEQLAITRVDKLETSCYRPPECSSSAYLCNFNANSCTRSLLLITQNIWQCNDDWYDLLKKMSFRLWLRSWEDKNIFPGDCWRGRLHQKRVEDTSGEILKLSVCLLFPCETCNILFLCETCNIVVFVCNFFGE